MEIPQNELDEQWSGCCSKTNSTFLKYIVQVIISVIILLFSIVMIVIKDGIGCEVYFSIISAIMGIYSPSPSLNKKQ
jgi:hypothetical protein